MELKNSRKKKPDTSGQPRVLMKSEIESLRLEMKEASIWLKQEIQRRKKKLKKTK